MTNLERLQMALSNKLYLTIDQYTVLLTENGLNSTEEYEPSHKKQLLNTQLDIFESLANNLDLYRKVETEFSNTSSAYANLQDRIKKIERQIKDIEELEQGNDIDQITYLYTN